MLFLLTLSFNCIYRLRDYRKNERLVSEKIIEASDEKFCEFVIKDELQFNEKELLYEPQVSCSLKSNHLLKKEVRKEIDYGPKLERDYFKDSDNPLFLISYFYWSLPSLAVDGIIYLHKSRFNNVETNSEEEVKVENLSQKIILKNKDIKLELYGMDSTVIKTISSKNNNFFISYELLELDKRERSNLEIKINLNLLSPLGRSESISHSLDLKKYEESEGEKLIMWRLRKKFPL